MCQNAKENYQRLLNDIFGTNKIKISIDSNTNNIIGALNNKDDYKDFKQNFCLLLNDLKNKYTIVTIQNVLKEIADDKNWEGAYAEAVAYSVLKNDYSGPIKTDITLKEGEGFAKECGQSKTNEDGLWENYNSYFDVKIFSDPIKEILDGIISRAKKETKSKKKCSVLAEYPLDDEESIYKSNISVITKELKDALQKKKSFLKISTLPFLTFRIHWGPGINTCITEYSPLRHAENTKDLMLKRYTKKLLKRKPVFIVFVKFPWFKQVVSSFADMNEVYYRALSRRTFMQYEHSHIKMQNINSKYHGKETARSVARHLTGIIIIEDNSVSASSKSDNIQKYDTYVYLNPNAKNSVCATMKDYLRGLATKMYEDFLYDNY